MFQNSVGAMKGLVPLMKFEPLSRLNLEVYQKLPLPTEAATNWIPLTPIRPGGWGFSSFFQHPKRLKDRFIKNYIIPASGH